MLSSKCDTSAADIRRTTPPPLPPHTCYTQLQPHPSASASAQTTSKLRMLEIVSDESEFEEFVAGWAFNDVTTSRAVHAVAAKCVVARKLLGSNDVLQTHRAVSQKSGHL